MECQPGVRFCVDGSGHLWIENARESFQTTQVLANVWRSRSLDLCWIDAFGWPLDGFGVHWRRDEPSDNPTAFRQRNGSDSWFEPDDSSWLGGNGVHHRAGDSRIWPWFVGAGSRHAHQGLWFAPTRPTALRRFC